MPSPSAARLATLDSEYLEGCEAGELRLQRCLECGHYRFPASPLCPRCLSTQSEWVASSGRGVVWSWIRMHQKYFKGFFRDGPYNILLVKLSEGPTMISALIDEQATLHIGNPVELEFRDTPDGPLPFFRAAGGTAGVAAVGPPEAVRD